MFFLGVHEPQVTAVITALLGPGMTFVDVGANWGYFTLLAAARVGAGGRVVALEPDPRVFPLLQENVGLNPVPQVTALPLAAADRPGSVLLEGFDQRGADGLSKLVTEPAGSGTVFSVAARTLDDLLDDIGVRSIHVLKMDIEGGEARALTGLRGYLASGRLDRLLLELHPRDLADVRSSPEDVMDFLRAAGYEGGPLIIPVPPRAAHITPEASIPAAGSVPSILASHSTVGRISSGSGAAGSRCNHRALAGPGTRNKVRRVPGGRIVIRRDMLATVRQVLGDRYTVDREIGRGGAARVYLACDAAGTKVALKILHPQLALSVTAERFLREIALLSQLDHPHIAKMLDWGEQDFLVYYVMRYIEGPNLRAHLDRARRASISDTLHIGRDVLDALAAAHAKGIVHRDVKPENIVLSPAHGAMLLDFGIARAIAASGTQRLTLSGFTVGTSAYMSPEQIGGDPIDHRSDLYSLGCVLFECLTGRPPFHDPLAETVLQMHTDADPPKVRKLRKDTPEPLAEAITTALAKSPAHRWQSAAEMLDRLEASV